MMIQKFVVLFVFCLALTTQCYAIWRGNIANRSTFNNVHKVSFLYNNSFKSLKETPFCTATVVGNYTILTSAHCTQKVRNINRVMVKVSNVKMIVENIFIPSSYESKYRNWRYHYWNFINYERRASNNASTQQQLKYYKKISQNAFKNLTRYDLALIRTKYFIPWNLERTKLNFNFQKVGDLAYAVGYGYIGYSSYNRGHIYPSRPNYRLEKMYGIFNDCHELFSNNRQDKITTSGDSGGPLILAATNEQIGVLGGQVEYEYVYSSVYSKLENQMSFILNYIK